MIFEKTIIFRVRSAITLDSRIVIGTRGVTATSLGRAAYNKR